ncbi:MULTISPECIES: hypothetical protein [Rhodococcus]|uniref:hypothetical protein n=1 Tax=Rhodococcus TaxID=1827 RepID=UPI001305326B|nr:hypothetical protein [Rhodococcus opacus]
MVTESFTDGEVDSPVALLVGRLGGRGAAAVVAAFTAQRPRRTPEHRLTQS